MLRCTIFLTIFMCLAAGRAHADVGVVLNESLDTSMDRITGSGHSAVYFSRICPDSPIRLRLCHAGEQGSVVSTYLNLGEDQPFSWNVAPLSVYLYGVEDPQNRPLFGSPEIKRTLEERYRDKYLGAYCSSRSCRTSDDADWHYMVASTLSRSVYIFTVETSVEQDVEFIDRFNSEPNVNHFNGIRRNCADFAMGIINSFFPHAARRQYINDFGITSPKAVARSFTHYALRHPELHLRIEHFAQVPGTIKRSNEVRSGTEQLVHSKKLLVPLVVVAHYELPFVAASYLLTGRFNPQHESEKHPTDDTAETSYEIQLARAANDIGRLGELQSIQREERDEVVGTAAEWRSYDLSFTSVVDAAVHNEVIPDREYLTHLFKRLDKEGTLVADPNGALWLEFVDGKRLSRVGLSASNILAPNSDALLSYQLLLAHTASELKSPPHSREIMRDFRTDWTLIHDARAKYLTQARTLLATFGRTQVSAGN